MGEAAASTKASLTEIRSAVDLLHGRLAFIDTNQQSLVVQLGLIAESVKDSSLRHAKAARKFAAMDQRLEAASAALARLHKRAPSPEEDDADPDVAVITGTGTVSTARVTWTGNTAGARASSTHQGVDFPHADPDRLLGGSRGGVGGGGLGGAGGGGLGGAGGGRICSGYDSSKPSPHVDAMGDVEATMEVKLATIRASLNESLAFLSSSTQRLGAKEQGGQVTTRSWSAPDQARKQLEIKHSAPLLISTHQVVGAGVPHADAIFDSTMPTRCLTSGLDINDNSDHSAVTVPSLGNTETAVLIPLELSLDKPMQSYVDLEYNWLTPTNCSMQCFHDGTGVQKFVSRPASSSSSSLTPFMLDGAEFSPTPFVTDVPVGGKISSAAVPPMMGEMADEVFTHVGGKSLFMELDLDSTHEVSKDMSLDEQLSGTVLTHDGDCSLVIEHDMDTCPEFQLHTRLQECWFSISLWSQIIRKTRTARQDISSFHVEQLFASRLHSAWDPGGLYCACLVQDCKHFAGIITVYFTKLLFDDGKSRVFAVELYVQWDPGIGMNTIVMSCTFPFSRWSRHQGDTIMAVLRGDAFRGRASEDAEDSIKLDTQSPILGIQDLCSVATLANKLEYMTWDPGIHSTVWALEVTAADTSDNASFLRGSHCRISSDIVWRLRQGHTVAWGLRGVVNVGDSKQRYIVPVLDHAQNTPMLMVIQELIWSLQGLQVLALLIVHEPQGLYWIPTMPDMTCVEVFVAHVQWDPGGFLSTMSDEHELARQSQC